MKQLNRKNLNGIRKMSIIGSGSFLLLSLIFNALIITNAKEFVTIARVLSVVSMGFAAVTLLSSITNKILLFSGYVGTAANGCIAVLSLYLAACTRLSFSSLISQSVVIANFILIIIVLLYKRIFIKNNVYIESIKKGTHSKYIREDSMFCLIITTIILSFAKFIDANKNIIELENVLGSIFLIAIAIIGVAFYITILAKYLYAQN